MTKEDVIEILERFVIGEKPCSQREIVDACASAYRMLKEQPSLPSNLDEAAREYTLEQDWASIGEEIHASFKAGAKHDRSIIKAELLEWAKEQKEKLVSDSFTSSGKCKMLERLIDKIESL